LLIGLVAVVVVVLIIDMPAYSRKKKEAFGVITHDFTAAKKVKEETLAEAAATSGDEEKDEDAEKPRE